MNSYARVFYFGWQRYPSSAGFLCWKNYSILGNDVRCKFIEMILKTLENSLIFLKIPLYKLLMLVHLREQNRYKFVDLA